MSRHTLSNYFTMEDEGSSAVTINVNVNKQAEADAAVSDTNDASKDIDDQQQATQTLDQTASTLESLLIEMKDAYKAGGMDERSARFMRIATESAVAPLGLTTDTAMRLPSLESFAPFSRAEATRVSIEEEEGFLKKTWTKIKEFFHAVWTAIKNFFGKIFGAKKKVDESVKESAEIAKEVIAGTVEVPVNKPKRKRGDPIFKGKRSFVNRPAKESLSVSKENDASTLYNRFIDTDIASMLSHKGKFDLESMHHAIGAWTEALAFVCSDSQGSYPNTVKKINELLNETAVAMTGKSPDEVEKINIDGVGKFKALCSSLRVPSDINGEDALSGGAGIIIPDGEENPSHMVKYTRMKKDVFNDDVLASITMKQLIDLAVAYNRRSDEADKVHARSNAIVEEIIVSGDKVCNAMLEMIAKEEGAEHQANITREMRNNAVISPARVIHGVSSDYLKAMHAISVVLNDFTT